MQRSLQQWSNSMETQDQATVAAREAYRSYCVCTGHDLPAWESLSYNQQSPWLAAAISAGIVFISTYTDMYEGVDQ